MSSHPLVSIIIPTLNSAKYIHRCLKALSMQIYPHIEVLIVDAGSTDATFAIIDQFKSKFTIQCFNIGKSTQSEARNYGIEYANGQYIAFCDSDDFYLPEKISKQIHLMEQQSLDVSYCDVLHFYTDHADRFFLNQHIDTGDILADCIAYQTINLNAVMVRKSFLDAHALRFPDGKLGRYGEDGNFIFQLAVQKARFAKLPEMLSVVEVRKDSHTQWEIQWQMKLCAIEYRLEAKPRIPMQYHDLLDKTVQSLQWKLVVSYWIAKQYQEAENILRAICPPAMGFLISGMCRVLRCFPDRWAYAVLTTLWSRHQKQTRHVYPTLQPSTQKTMQDIFAKTG